MDSATAGPNKVKHPHEGFASNRACLLSRQAPFKPTAVQAAVEPSPIVISPFYTVNLQHSLLFLRTNTFPRFSLPPTQTCHSEEAPRRRISPPFTPISPKSPNRRSTHRSLPILPCPRGWGDPLLIHTPPHLPLGNPTLRHPVHASVQKLPKSKRPPFLPSPFILPVLTSPLTTHAHTPSPRHHPGRSLLPTSRRPPPKGRPRRPRCRLPRQPLPAHPSPLRRPRYPNPQRPLSRRRQSHRRPRLLPHPLRSMAGRRRFPIRPERTRRRLPNAPQRTSGPRRRCRLPPPSPPSSRRSPSLRPARNSPPRHPRHPPPPRPRSLRRTGKSPHVVPPGPGPNRPLRPLQPLIHHPSLPPHVILRRPRDEESPRRDAYPNRHSREGGNPSSLFPLDG